MARMRMPPPRRPSGQHGPHDPKGFVSARAAAPPAQFGALTAASLYCPKCQRATPVREHLLLVLPDGNLFDYRCSVCATSTGTRTARG
ncbi:MAG TPA: hypothetical protein VML36_01670 [Nitrospiria bacterium]|nr:hypothetical protein [Nitrospiria bacterium]